MPGIEPREGKLTDARNNGTSPSFINLFHQWLGSEYFDGAPVEEAAWPGSPSGSAIFTYRRTVDLFPEGAPFRLSNVNGGGGTWSSAYNDGAATKYYLQANIGSSADNLRLSFRFTGYAFDLVHAVLSDGARYELLVNGVSKGVYSTRSADLGRSDGFGAVRTHDMGAFVRNALIELRVIAGDPARVMFRAEAIRIHRVLRVTNNSINGADVVGYYLNLLRDAVKDDDRFVFTGMGSNDRLLTAGIYPPPTGTVTAYRTYLGLMTQALQDRGCEVILLTDPAARNETAPAYRFRMVDTRAAMIAVARERGCDMIDEYARTRSLLDADDTSELADSVHPSDLGHRNRFRRLRDAIAYAPPTRYLL